MCSTVKFPDILYSIVLYNKQNVPLSTALLPTTNIHKLLPYFCKPDFTENVSLLYEICIVGSNWKKTQKGAICEYWYVLLSPELLGTMLFTQYLTLMYSKVLCGTVLYSNLLYFTIHYYTLLYSTVMYNNVLQGTMQYCVLCGVLKYYIICILQHCTIL